jgi:hypothetical protein
MKMKIVLNALASISCVLGVQLAFAQDSEQLEVPAKDLVQHSEITSDEEVAVYFDQMRAEFRKNKAAWVGSQMNLSASEGEVFWRVYAEYERELIALNDKRIESINDYLENFDKMSSEKASAVLARYFANQRARISLREKYASKISRVLSPVVGLRFAHVEAQIALVIEAELAARLPFAEAFPAE